MISTTCSPTPSACSPGESSLHPKARARFLAAIAHIESERPGSGRKLVDQVRSALRRLERFPNIGTAIAEFPSVQYRQRCVGPYRFFYRVVERTIWIADVWHEAQQPTRPSKPR